MDIERWAHIRHLFRSEKLSVSAIARHLGLDRKTVRKALRDDSFLDKPKRKRPSMLDPYRDEIERLLEEYPDLSAVRILEEIRKKGFKGRITILRDYVRQLKACRQEPYLRLTVPAGMQAQADWGHCGPFRIGGTTRPLYCFALVLSFSRVLHLEFTLTMSMEAFLEAHVKAFEFFRGCSKEILYDNLSSVVLSRLGSSIRYNPRFLDFAGFYGFRPRACNIKKAREKGRVEMSIKYIKRNFLAGRTFTSLNDLRHQALKWRDEVANVRRHGTTRRRPVDMLEEEHPCLLPLPDRRYDTALRLPMVCPPDAFLRFQTNLYSVPFSCVGRELLLKADMHAVQVFDGERMVAEHRRCYERYQCIENSSHRREILRKRVRASFSKAYEELGSLGPECTEYLEGLNRCEIDIKKHVTRLFDLSRIYGVTELRQAITRAVSFEAFGTEYIENIIVKNRRRRHAKNPAGPVQRKSRPELAYLSVSPHPLECYDEENKNPETPETQNENKEGTV